ncbi:MAG: hypothetical protein CMP39_04190 [Rickettsiales bacterium]|nr:hypothetical protein [Rickettsiales bacterium]|tara:strand:- start:99 stop:509 length:411 start_codon:yes stop_codon:yes gene_type:complete
MSNLIELVIEAEYLLKVARVCPVKTNKTELVSDMAKHYEVSQSLIRKDFENYLADYFKNQDVQERWNLYTNAKERSNPNIGDDEALYIADLLTEDLTGLQDLNVELNSSSWEGDVRLKGLIFNDRNSKAFRTQIGL